MISLMTFCRALAPGCFSSPSGWAADLRGRTSRRWLFCPGATANPARPNRASGTVSGCEGLKRDAQRLGFLGFVRLRARRGCGGRESRSVPAHIAAPRRNCDRRMMSQMDLTAPLTDCCVAWRLPLFLSGSILGGMVLPLLSAFRPGAQLFARREFAFNHAAYSASDISPAASASVRTAASASLAWNSWPLRSRKPAPSMKPVRLLPSMNG